MGAEVGDEVGALVGDAVDDVLAGSQENNTASQTYDAAVQSASSTGHATDGSSPATAQQHTRRTPPALEVHSEPPVADSMSCRQSPVAVTMKGAAGFPSAEKPEHVAEPPLFAPIAAVTKPKVPSELTALIRDS